MGWPSYKEDIEKRREESGLPHDDGTWRRRPKFRANAMEDARRDFLDRNAAYAEIYRASRRKGRFKRFFKNIIQRLFGWI